MGISSCYPAGWVFTKGFVEVSASCLAPASSCALPNLHPMSWVGWVGPWVNLSIELKKSKKDILNNIEYV